MKPVLRSVGARARGGLLVLAIALPGIYATGAAGPAYAQETEETTGQGQVRIQNRSTEIQEDVLPEGPSGPLLDFREQMRDFVGRIASFARSHRQDFQVIVENGLELLVKRDDIDETQTSPARTYMRSIDGVLATNLFSGEAPASELDEPEALRQRRLDYLETAKRNGLNVYVLDTATDPAVIDAGRRKAEANGMIYHARESDSFAGTVLPEYPSRPFGENSHSVISRDGIRNFAVVGNSSAYGREDEFALMMHKTNYDLVIVDVFHGRQPLSKQAVETLKYKASGGRRLVFARINIGTAASYRYYWQPNWRQGSPPWIGAELRGEPDHYYVEFWQPEWQQIIYGDTESYVYGVVAQGYDGIVLGGADIFEIFEGGAAAEARLGE